MHIINYKWDIIKRINKSISITLSKITLFGLFLSPPFTQNTTVEKLHYVNLLFKPKSKQNILFGPIQREKIWLAVKRNTENWVK